MKRRQFIGKAVAGTAAGTLLAGCSTQNTDAPAIQTGTPNVRWTLASSFARSLDTIYAAAEVMSQRVSELTDGRFVIRVYPAGEIVPAFEVLDSVQKRTVEMGHSAGYYYIGKNPAFAFETTVPFGLTARQYNSWVYQGGGQDILRQLFADYEVLNYPGGNTGAQMGGWFNREINSLNDLKGLSMRIPGLGGRVMDQLGVSVQQIPGGEIYPALDRGAIDAAEWVGPYDDEKLGFNQVARYYYFPGWWEPSANLSFFINQAAMADLPLSYQAALEASMAEANQTMLTRYDALNPPALQRIIHDSNVELKPFPDDVMNAAYSASQDLLGQERLDSVFAQVHDSFLAWRQDSDQWMHTAEYAMISYMNRHLRSDS
ncbi:MAG: TRAP transporter substrate-binding protein [Bacteroidetes bacterium]|nr:TRAP transporter substrate-binding protein [Bacteroidota bacterium]MCY4223975.1 TRAP transporter substrate-binding protein [Bacteroidota bacterium]